MYFTRSVMASALMGFAAATNHMMASEAALLASATASAVSSLSTGAVEASTGVAPAAEGMVVTHVVKVGGPNGTLIFSPNNVVAAAGDLVQFQFNPKNHSVVQSTFDQPCVPIQNIQANKTDAFFSGFMPTNATAAASSSILTYTIRVKDTKPVWFYCSQGMHCMAGMVGAINAPASGNKTLTAFAALAKGATENLSPGQAAGSGATGNTPAGPASPSGGAGGAGGAAGNLPPTPTASAPAQNTANAAPVLSGQSFFGLGAAAIAAFALL